MKHILEIEQVSKKFEKNVFALNKVNLSIEEGEIFALLGPNGAGKTTLISSICGIINQTEGKISVKGFDTISNWRKCRSLIGLVPQELTLDSFETVWSTVSLSRGLFGKAPNKSYLEWVLKSLSLLDKKNTKITALSGGMKRRVLIAKALCHEPKILFLDEPTAGVDVSLRKDMWELVKELRKKGVTIILTTHYIEEAEAISDRIGIIDKGKLLLVEEKNKLIEKMGKKELVIELQAPLERVPENLKKFNLSFSKEKKIIKFYFDRSSQKSEIAKLLSELEKNNFIINDLRTKESNLEEIFLKLVEKRK